jgi:hypothetical protein
MLEILIAALILASGLTGWAIGRILHELDRPTPLPPDRPTWIVPESMYRPEHRHFIALKGGKNEHIGGQNG